MTSQPAASASNDPRRVIVDAAATSEVIAALRRQLRHQGIMEHPDVSRELRKLEEQLAVLMTKTGETGGRHRVTTAPTSARHGAGPGGGKPAGAARVAAVLACPVPAEVLHVLRVVPPQQDLRG